MRTLGIGTLLIAVLAIVVFTLSDRQQSTENNQTENSTSLAGNQAVVGGGLESVATDNVVQDEATDSALDATELERSQLLWIKKRGLDTSSWRSYFSLSDEDLEALVQSQDVRAIEQLASRYMSRDPVKATEYYELAATLESLNALNGLSALWAGHKTPSDEMWKLTSSKNRGVVALSYLYVSLRRGDNVLSNSTLVQLNKQFAYTQSDMQEACRLAREKYRYLNASRVAMGLSDFDNTPSPAGDDLDAVYSVIQPCE